MAMSNDDLLTALDEIEGLARSVRAELEQRGLERIWFDRAAPEHTQRAMRRLGTFSADELARMLGLRRTAALARAQAAIDEGLLVELDPVGKTHARRFRWVG